MPLRQLLPTLTAQPLQITTYLLGVALFSISFLVFLNSSVSFVITDLIGQENGVGDAVGSLGFADELVALVACPVWGIVSDRVGVRTVCVTGYAIVGLSLILFVQAKNVYPQLLLARLFFSLGGAATSTMVTAILPTMTERSSSPANKPEVGRENGQENGHTTRPSVSSEITITPARYRSQSPNSRSTSQPPRDSSTKAQGAPPEISGSSTSQLAGLVGTFTGLGAVIALGIFLPLPARFQKAGISPPAAVAYSFYIVGSIAFIIAIFCFIGLRRLPGEDDKHVRALLGRKPQKLSSETLPADVKGRSSSYADLILSSISLAFRDQNIGLAYLGGLVARASSVGISLFIPLFVNAYFISSGLCPAGRNGSNDDIKRNCRRAYSLAAALTGVSQLVALLFAPAFGYLSGRYKRLNVPLLAAALAGVVGYVAFGKVKNPDPSSEGGSAVVFPIVALLGISQIGAIVCSLGLLGRGIQCSGDETAPSEAPESEDRHNAGTYDAYPSAAAHTTHRHPTVTTAPSPAPARKLSSSSHTETAPLLPPISQSANPLPTSTTSSHSTSRTHLKGSIAGLYSLSGGAGILLLTKLGGYMFDTVGAGSPFFLLAGFNGILLVVGVLVGLEGELRKRRRGGDGGEDGEVVASRIL